GGGAQGELGVGDLRQAMARFLEAAGADPVPLPGFFAAWPHAWLGVLLSHLGRFPEALEHAEQAMQIAARAQHPHTLVEAHGALAGVSLERGDLETAQHVFERGIGLVRPGGVADANLLSGLGHAYALSGRLAEALPLLEQTVRRDVSISAMGLGLAVRISRLADAYRRTGRADLALGHARSAVELARKHGERANEAIALRALAEITALGAPGDAAGAASIYADSLALAEELGMRPLAAHCHLGLGALCRQADRAQGEAHLATSIAMYREMDMRFWLAQAEAARQTDG